MGAPFWSLDVTEDNSTDLRENASAPRKTAVDGVEVEQHPLPDQIAADRYEASKKAVKKKGLAGLFRKLVPPGGS